MSFRFLTGSVNYSSPHPVVGSKSFVVDVVNDSAPDDNLALVLDEAILDQYADDPRALLGVLVDQLNVAMGKASSPHTVSNMRAISENEWSKV